LYELSGSFSRKLQIIRNNADRATPAISDYFKYTQERRELVADAVARQAVTLELLEETVDNEQKAIVFQERIEQLERMVAPKETRGRDARTGGLTDTDVDRAQLYERYPALKRIDEKLEEVFFTASYRPVMYHSGRRDKAWNDFGLEWFSDGVFDDQPYDGFGVETYEEFRPLTADGGPEFTNLRAAVTALVGYDFAAEKSGSGVSIATGYAAGRAAAQEAQ
jgi:hypothetical protein